MKKRGIKRRTKFFVKFYLGATLLIMFAFLVFSLMTIVLVTNQWWDEKIDMLDMNCHSIAEDYTKVLQTTDSEGRDRALNVLVLGNDMEAFSKATEADYFITDLNGNIIVCRHFFDNNGKKCEEHSKIKLKSELVEGTKQGGVTELTGLEEGVDGTDFVVGVPVSYGGKVVAEVFGTIDAVGGLLPYVASLSEMILIAALLTLILAFLIIYAYSRTYTRPIVDMIEATDHYAKSDFTYHIDDRKLDGEMAEMARAQNRMAGEIAIYDQTQKSFVANVSHELKTPMTTIGGFVDGILDGTIPKEKEKEYLSTVSSEVKRLARLVVAMLNLSKMESGEIGITPVKYRIQTQIFEALFSMEQRINDKNITINGLEEIDDVKIVADRDLLHQVVFNLIDNAVKFTPENGEISFFAKSDSDGTTVTIRNSGPGVSPEQIARIFERFYKVDQSRSFDVKGVGLGLYIVKTIINMHDGKIEANSKEGEYTEFTFVIPR